MSVMVGKESDPAKVALWDMDGSIVDFDAAMRRDLEAMRAPCEPPIPEELWREFDDQPHIKARMRAIKLRPGWWRELAPIQDALDLMQVARQAGFTNHVLTKGPYNNSPAWAEKVDWCRTYLGPDADLHLTTEKSLVYGVMLYDDYPEYMLRWLERRPRGLGIMPVRCYNRDFQHPNVVWYTGDNKDEMRRAMVIALNRKPGDPLVLR